MNMRTPELARHEIDTHREAAALWSERLREAGADPDLRARFEEWCGDDPAKREAFRQAEAAWRLARSVADEPEMLELRNKVLSRAASERKPVFSAARLSVLAASVLVCVGFGFVLANWAMPGEAVEPSMVIAEQAASDFETQIGERLTTPLADGSTMTLGTSSRARVAFSDQERLVELVSGQAYFDVAHEDGREFVVLAAGRRVTAVGTAFEVRVDSAQLSVTLVEGNVVVDAPVSVDQGAAGEFARSERAELSPGEQLVQVADAPPSVATVDARRLTSWLDGLLIFEDEPLSAAVAEMNRYARRPIVIADEQLSALRLSGAFSAGQSSGFVEALAEYFPEVRIDETDHAIILRSAI